MTTTGQQPDAEPRAAARLVSSAQRCAFLLDTARLVISDDDARRTAGEAAAEARCAIAAFKRAFADTAFGSLA
jgi:hypothetical protein